MKKKILSFILIILSVLFFNINVKADSLNDYGIICQYGDLYVKYYSPNTNTVFKIETNFDYYLGIDVENGRPKKIISNEEEMNWLKSVGLVIEVDGRNMFTCPNDKPFGSNLNRDALSSKTYGHFSGIINNFPSVYTVYAKYTSDLTYDGVFCEYGVDKMDGTGSFITDSNGKEKVFYSFSYTGKGWNEVYKFGNGYEKIKKLGIDLEGGRPKKTLKDTEEFNWLIESGIIISTGNEEYKKAWSCPTTLDDINDLDNDGHKVYTLMNHGCKTTTGEEGSICFTANIKDKVVTEQDNPETGECPYELKPIIKFIKLVVFNTIQIFVPILLILLGSIDLAKAVMASDEKLMKDAMNRFIRRIIMAVLMFFIVTIVTVVMNMFAKVPDVGAQDDWKACWFD